MKKTKFTYIVIAVASFIALTSVQAYLIYNTYKLRNDQYKMPEKEIVKEWYERLMTNENLFPGAGKIVDRYIENDNIYLLEKYYHSDTAQFGLLRQRMLDSTWQALTAANNMDSLLAEVLKANNIEDTYQYALYLNAIDVAFESNVYIPLYEAGRHYPLLNPDAQKPAGLLIGGTLDKTRRHNLVTALSLSSLREYSYRISFSLFLDTDNRHLAILKLMWPVLLLSVLSILGVVIIFFATYMNWLRQRKLSEMKSDFINNITHELHTPLAAIAVAGKSLRNNKITEKKENIIALTDVIERQSSRLRQLITQVLDITASGKIALNKSEHSIDKQLEEIMLDFRLKYTEENIVLELHKNAQDAVVKMDPFWFATMVFNLLDNAVKYNTSTEKKITVSTRHHRKFLELRIEDNGRGIPGGVQQYIFDKFYRHTRETGMEIKGLGLGLYYVKQCVDAHGWDVQISSQPGKGTVFLIAIPLQIKNV